jgi:hypothetical protein
MAWPRVERVILPGQIGSKPIQRRCGPHRYRADIFLHWILGMYYRMYKPCTYQMKGSPANSTFELARKKLPMNPVEMLWKKNGPSSSNHWGFRISWDGREPKTLNCPKRYPPEDAETQPHR